MTSDQGVVLHSVAGCAEDVSFAVGSGTCKTVAVGSGMCKLVAAKSGTCKTVKARFQPAPKASLMPFHTLGAWVDELRRVDESSVLHPTPYTLHLNLSTLHHAPCTSTLTPYTLHPAPQVHGLTNFGASMGLLPRWIVLPCKWPDALNTCIMRWRAGCLGVLPSPEP